MFYLTNYDLTAAIGTFDDIGIAFTYRELNKKSNQLARLLQKNGVTADTIVGIMMGPGADMIVSLLAVLKAGVAYLPIDTAPIKKAEPHPGKTKYFSLLKRVQ